MPVPHFLESACPTQSRYHKRIAAETSTQAVMPSCTTDSTPASQKKNTKWMITMLCKGETTSITNYSMERCGELASASGLLNRLLQCWEVLHLSLDIQILDWPDRKWHDHNFALQSLLLDVRVGFLGRNNIEMLPTLDSAQMLSYHLACWNLINKNGETTISNFILYVILSSKNLIYANTLVLLLCLRKQSE